MGFAEMVVVVTLPLMMSQAEKALVGRLEIEHDVYSYLPYIFSIRFTLSFRM